MVLQKQIAEKAGVSYATVSRALTHSAKVRPETLQKIREAMRELGIQSTDEIFLGRNTTSRIVLLVVGDIRKDFFAKTIAGLCAVLEDSGYLPVLCNSGYETERERKALLQADENGWAGIVMLTAVESDGLVQFLQQTRIPVVMVNRYIRSLDLDVVRIDNYRGSYLAACHLLEHGHRRIAHLAGSANSAAVQDRVRGFTDAMQDYGITVLPPDITYGEPSEASGRAFANWLADQDYTAAYISSDYAMTMGVVHQLLRRKKRIPEDISVLCFDDAPAIDKDGLNITAVSFDPETMGKAAAELLLKRMADPLGLRTKIIYSPSLRQRGSIRALQRSIG